MAGKGSINLSLFTDNMIVYLQNPTETKKKKIPLELRCEFSKTAGYKISIQNKCISTY